MDETMDDHTTNAPGDVILGGQPTADELRAWAVRGVRTVVNLRLPSEDPGFDERRLVRELGMEYRNPGFKEAYELTDAVFDEVRETLRDPERKLLLLHCLSANRVGAIWLAYRVLDQGIAFDEALGEAVDVGLRSEAYIEKTRDYITRHSLQ